MKIGRFRTPASTPFKVSGPGFTRDKLVSLGAALGIAHRQAEQATGTITLDVIEYDDIIYRITRDEDGTVWTRRAA